MPTCYLEDYEIRALEAVMVRLFTENRMSGDIMRDNAQKIEGVLRSIKQTEISEPRRGRKSS
jgi:hypothetical protein